MKENSVNFKLEDTETNKGAENAENAANMSGNEEGDEPVLLKVPPNGTETQKKEQLKHHNCSDKVGNAKTKHIKLKDDNMREKKTESDRDSNTESDHQRKKQKQNYLRRRILHRRDKSIEIDSDSSDAQSLHSFEADGDGGWDNISQHTLLSKDEVHHSVQRTSIVSSNNASLFLYFCHIFKNCSSTNF